MTNTPLTEKDFKNEFYNWEYQILYKKVQSAKLGIKEDLIKYHLLDKHIINIIDEWFNIPDGDDDK